MSTTSDDIRFMRRALQLARGGDTRVSPNPMVGAVVVHNGVIVGEGFHRRWGEAHAEVNAINAVRDRAILPQCTIYVTLEPCAHYGKTPPCARLLVDKRLKRVVVGTLDPFERVAGRGVAILREAGIEVTVGVLEGECRALNRRFITAHATQRPWVMLKWAQSADGFIAPHDGRTQFSTPLTTTLMHRERARVDAIVVGARTALIDNPSLTTRHWPGRSPLRVVLDKRASLAGAPGLTLLTDGAPTLIFNDTRTAREGNVEWVALDTSSPAAWLRHLYHRGITSVMVEGGASILNQLIEAHAWDLARIETASFNLYTGLPAPRLPHSTGLVHTTRLQGNTITLYTPA